MLLPPIVYQMCDFMEHKKLKEGDWLPDLRRLIFPPRNKQSTRLVRDMLLFVAFSQDHNGS